GADRRHQAARLRPRPGRRGDRERPRPDPRPPAAARRGPAAAAPRPALPAGPGAQGRAAAARPGAASRTAPEKAAVRHAQRRGDHRADAAGGRPRPGPGAGLAPARRAHLPRPARLPHFFALTGPQLTLRFVHIPITLLTST